MDRNEWQGATGKAWAAEWRRTDRSFTAVTEELLRRTRDSQFDRVLDVGCGAGELSLAIARGRPRVKVIGVDVSAPLVAAAMQRADNLTNVRFVEADATDWRPDEPFAPQLLVSRHGVMFFDEPAAAFANLAELSDAQSKLIFSCFRAASENPFFTEVMRLLPEPAEMPPPGAPGPFGFADPDHIRSVLREGGWGDIEIDPFDFSMVTGTGEDPIEDTVGYFASIGGAARQAREMAPHSRERFFDRVRGLAKRHCFDDVVSLPAAGWIVTARKAS